MGIAFVGDFALDDPQSGPCALEIGKGAFQAGKALCSFARRGFGEINPLPRFILALAPLRGG